METGGDCSKPEISLHSKGAAPAQLRKMLHVGMQAWAHYVFGFFFFFSPKKIQKSDFFTCEISWFCIGYLLNV